MILIIDNYDSFTYNLYQQVESQGFSTKIVLNDQITVRTIEDVLPNKIIISPGPGSPGNAGISKVVIREFYRRIPIFGVCLGFQCIGEVFGVKVQQARQLIHGKTTMIHHNDSILFNGVPDPFEGARYHSLAINQVPPDFRLSAWDDTREIMAIEHNNFPLYGVQFHPESFLTDWGDRIIENFLNAG